MHIKLHLDNVTTTIDPPLKGGVYKDFKKELGYRPADYLWRQSPNPNWDGFISCVCYNRQYCKCAVKHDNMHFPTGLISKAIQFFKDNSVTYEIFDSRDDKIKDSVGELELHPNPDIPLYDYQEPVVAKALESQRGIIKIATGGGKSAVIANIVAKLSVSPTIIYVTSIDLLRQMHEELEKFVLDKENNHIKAGMVGGGYKDIKDITVVTYQTAIRALDAKFIKSDDEDLEKDETDISDIKDKLKETIIKAKLIIFDECQHVSCETAQVISDYSKDARWRWGASVFGDSYIELKGNEFKSGWKGSIKEAWEKTKTKECLDNGYLIKKTDGIFCRSWNGNNFSWNPLKKIIKHENGKSCYQIRFAGGNSIKTTEDHSIFIVENDKLIEKKPEELKINDLLLMDNGNGFENNKFPKFNLFDLFKKNPNKIRVAVDLSKVNLDKIDIDNKILSTLKRRGKVAKKYGGSLYLSQYLKYENILPSPKWLYTEASNGTGIKTKVNLEELFYFFGFYLGDGWTDHSRLNFAIENDKYKKFIKRFNKLFPDVRPKVRIMPGKSVEIRISCKPLTHIFKELFEDKKCYDKRIPDQLLFVNEKLRKSLLNGLIDSDGSRKRSKVQLKRNNKNLSYTSTSFELIQDIQFLLRTLNCSYTLSIRKPAPGGMINERRIVSKRNSYQIKWSENSMNGKNENQFGNTSYNKLFKNGIQKKILGISKIETEKEVYDLEVDKHPSFVANGVLVHNSATPTRDSEDDILIDSCFGKQICDVKASDLIKRGFLVQPHIAFIPIKNLPFKKNGTYPNIYKEAIVENDYRNEVIAKLAVNLEKKGRRTLILVKHIEHGKMLESIIPGSKFIYGSTKKKDRKNHLDDIREEKEEARITIASVIFDEGINVKSLDALILAGSGKSSTRALQRIGRVIRTFKYSDGTEKKDAYVYDFWDYQKYLNRHSQARKKMYLTEPLFNVIELDSPPEL